MMRARVRPVRHEDLALVLEWRNHPDIRRHMLTQHEIQPAEHARWFDAASQDPSRRLLMVESADGPIGYVQFSGVAPDSVCDWGFYARPDARTGSGSLLGFAALAFAFDALGVHKVRGQALGSNAASIRLHEKLGFQREGILRQQHRTEQTWEDLVCFGLLRDEWRKAHPAP